MKENSDLYHTRGEFLSSGQPLTLGSILVKLPSTEVTMSMMGRDLLAKKK